MSQHPDAGAEQHEASPRAGDDGSCEKAAAEQAQKNKSGAKRSKDSREDALGQKARPSLVVRYGLMRQIGQFRYNREELPRPGRRVVVRTERGVELGEVVSVVTEGECGHHACIGCKQLEEYVKANGSDFPFRRDGRVLRLANHQDEIDQRHLNTSATEAGAYCRRQIRELKLKMKLVTVEHLLGGERIIFYFSAESRVDFRELVRRLASEFRTRIEMRQVGARDEARLVADYERCGQRCCCQQFIKDLQPVSMRMAKTQKATLDPAKISGRCGRLMCCLRYEDQTYAKLRKQLPRRNTWVRADQTVGRVVDTQILTQLVKLQLPDHTMVVVANETITQRNVDPPEVNEPSVRSNKRPVRQRVRRKLYPDADAGEQPETPTQTNEKPGGPSSTEQKTSQEAQRPKKRQRRGRRKKRGKGESGSQGKQGGGSSRKSGKPGRKKRRKPKKPSS
jgi:cell fate regulator YaaT (PSP1 superfamily)